MRKKLSLLLLLLLIPTLCYAWGVMIVGGGVPAGGSSCTIGTESTYAGAQGCTGAGMIVAEKFAASGSCTVDKMKAYVLDVHAADREVVLAIYSDNAGEPNSRLDYTSPWYAGSSGGTWTGDLALSVALTDGTSYWLVFLFENTNSGWYKNTTGGITRRYEPGWNAGVPPASWNTGGDTDQTWTQSYYAWN